jgi:hypothetical protein
MTKITESEQKTLEKLINRALAIMEHSPFMRTVLDVGDVEREQLRAVLRRAEKKAAIYNQK